jgi:hypothetical protein
VPRVNDRRVLNGIFWVLRSGAPWRDLPDNFGPYTTCYNRFVRWRMLRYHFAVFNGKRIEDCKPGDLADEANGDSSKADWTWTLPFV